MKPQFTPTQGIGTIYKDPRTGQTFTYTNQGWELQSTDIQGETKQKDTFEIKPDEKYFAERARSNGASEDEVRRGILEDRRIRGNITAGGGTIGEEPETVPDEADTTNPFFDKDRGRLLTKQEAMIDAYNQGITDPDELNKVGSLYDSLAGEEDGELEGIDIEGLSSEELTVAKEKVKEVAIAKAQNLGTGAERESAIGALATMESGQEIVDLLTGADAVKTGIGSGVYRKGLSVFGRKIIPGARALEKTSESEDELAAKMTLFTANFIKAISGKQVSDEERGFLMDALPSEYKGEQQNKEGIKAIADWLENFYSPTLGVDISPLKPEEQVDLNNPLDI